MTEKLIMLVSTIFIYVVVDGIAVTIVRLHKMGLRHVVVSNLPSMKCIPLVIGKLDFMACTTDSALLTQTKLYSTCCRSA